MYVDFIITPCKQKDDSQLKRNNSKLKKYSKSQENSAKSNRREQQSPEKQCNNRNTINYILG